VSRKAQKVWVVEVQYTPAGDGRRRPWSRSVAMTFSEARVELIGFQRMGHRARLVELPAEVSK